MVLLLMFTYVSSNKINKNATFIVYLYYIFNKNETHIYWYKYVVSVALFWNQIAAHQKIESKLWYHAEDLHSESQKQWPWVLPGKQAKACIFKFGSLVFLPFDVGFTFSPTNNKLLHSWIFSMPLRTCKSCLIRLIAWYKISD